MQHQQILDWINEQRREYTIGGPLAALPKGVPGDSCNCVIGRALGTPVVPAMADTGDVYLVDHSIPLDERTFIEVPDYVGDFICAFDRGDIPELVEDAA